MLTLHVLQICLVYVNTLMIQRVLTGPGWTQRMLPDDLCALTPLIYTQVTPYGILRLDYDQRLAIEQDAVAVDFHIRRYFALGDTNVFTGPGRLDGPQQSVPSLVPFRFSSRRTIFPRM
jgi:Tn3 transposase DDE domain